METRKNGLASFAVTGLDVVISRSCFAEHGKEQTFITHVHSYCFADSTFGGVPVVVVIVPGLLKLRFRVAIVLNVSENKPCY